MTSQKESLVARLTSNTWLFVLAILLGMALVLIPGAISAWNNKPLLTFSKLNDGIEVTQQIWPEQIRQIDRRNYRTVIDIRPDGETKDQPTSAEIAKIMRDEGVNFVYVPVPRGDIPNASVDALADALAKSPKPVLLYCRIGRRAARAWGLAEASRPGGLDAAAIAAAVKTIGFSVDDLSQQIAHRIANRSHISETTS
jgi:uncharacterized protein (TIGR01244 family)